MNTKLLILPCLMAIMAVFSCVRSEAGPDNTGSEALTDMSFFTSSPQAAVVEWGNAEHDFGVIPQNVPAAHTFEFVNTGDSPLHLERVKQSCGCTAVDWSRESILPGEKGFVKAAYNAKKTGMFKKSVTVFSNAQDSIFVYYLKGEVITAGE